MSDMKENEQIGIYTPPEKPRFRFDDERHCVESLVPNIELVDKQNRGMPPEYRQLCALKINDKTYSIYAGYREEYGTDGQPVGLVWYQIQFFPGYELYDGKGWLDVERVNGNVDEETIEIIKEYFFTNRIGKTYPSVSKIEFSEQFPIDIKMWEVR